MVLYGGSTCVLLNNNKLYIYTDCRIIINISRCDGDMDSIRYIKDDFYYLKKILQNSSRFNFEENIAKFKRNLIERGYPERLIHETLSEVKFEKRNAALTQKLKLNK